MRARLRRAGGRRSGEERVCGGARARDAATGSESTGGRVDAPRGTRTSAAVLDERSRGALGGRQGAARRLARGWAAARAGQGALPEQRPTCSPPRQNRVLSLTRIALWSNLIHFCRIC